MSDLEGSTEKLASLAPPISPPMVQPPSRVTQGDRQTSTLWNLKRAELDMGAVSLAARPAMKARKLISRTELAAAHDLLHHLDVRLHGWIHLGRYCHVGRLAQHVELCRRGFRCASVVDRDHLAYPVLFPHLQHGFRSPRLFAFTEFERNRRDPADLGDPSRDDDEQVDQLGSGPATQQLAYSYDAGAPRRP